MDIFNLVLVIQERVLDSERVLAVVQIGGELLRLGKKTTCRLLGVLRVLRGWVETSSAGWEKTPGLPRLSKSEVESGTTLRWEKRSSLRCRLLTRLRE